MTIKTILSIIFSISIAISQKVISLNNAIQIATEKSFSIISSQQNVESQKSNLNVAFGSLFPSFNISTSFDETKTNSPNKNNSNKFTSDFGYNSNASITITSGMLDGFEKAKLDVKISELSHKEKLQTIQIQTIQLYLNILRTKELLEVRKENLNRSKSQLTRIQEIFKVGGIAQSDVFRQQVIVSNDELSLIQSQNEFDKANVDLVLFLALNPLENYIFEDETISKNINENELQNFDVSKMSVDSLVEIAIENRLNYTLAKKNLDVANLQLKYYEGELYPSLTLNSNLNYGGEKFSTTTFGNFSIGATFSYPIFNNFRTENSIQQSKIKIESAKENLSLKEREIKAEIKKILLDFDAAKKSLEVSQVGVISATEDRKIADEKYTLGAGTLLDKIIADANYISAVNNKVNTVYNYFLIQKNFEYTLGILK